MKKRRELDAIKMGRRKKITNGQHELLQNDSGSSEIDEFIMPTHKSLVRNQSCCRLCVTLIGFVLVVACLISCAGVVWMHVDLKRELELLRESVDKVQSGNSKIPSEFSALSSKEKQLSEELDKFQSGKNGIHEIMANITLLFKQVAALQANTQGLEKSLSAAKEIIGLPGKLQTVTKTLASQGSEIKSTSERLNMLKHTYNVGHEKNNRRLGKLEATNSDAATLLGRRVKNKPIGTDGVLKKDIQAMYFKLSELNRTTVEKFQFLEKVLGTHYNQILTLQNNTYQLDLSLQILGSRVEGTTSKPVNWHHLVMEAMNSTMQSTKAVPNAKLRSLEKQVRNLTLTVEYLSAKPVENLNITTTNSNRDCLEQIQELGRSLASLNKTVVVLQRGLTEKLSQIDHEIKNVTRPDQHSGSTLMNLTRPSSVSPATDHIKQVPTTEELLAATGTSNNQSENVTGPIPLVPEVNAVTPAMPDLRKHVSMKGYNNSQDVETGFYRWDLDGDGRVIPADMVDFLGPTMPDIKLLLEFDSDHDGTLSMKEMEAAFGFEMPPTSAPANTDDVEDKGVDDNEEAHPHHDSMNLFIKQLASSKDNNPKMGR